ncbi:MAG: hypothetical protein J6A25_05905 [Lachnospiraceae bacterium]|nr:hypothetical protein [Lachnospiraceae bacterium]
MAKETKLKKLWLWNKKPKEEFNPQSSALSQVTVKCTLLRRFKSFVEVAYNHPRINKQVKTILPAYWW